MMRVFYIAILASLTLFQDNAVFADEGEEYPNDPNTQLNCYQSIVNTSAKYPAAILYPLLEYNCTPYSPNGRYVEASVYMNCGRATLKLNTLDKTSSVAYGFYNDSILTTGWSQLQIKAGYGRRAADRDLYYAAGFLEGALTSKQIYQNFVNTWSKMKISFKRMVNPRAMFKQFFDTQDKWARKQIRRHRGRNGFWRHVEYVLAQFDGLYDGYKSTAGAHFVSVNTGYLVLVETSTSTSGCPLCIV